MHRLFKDPITLPFIRYEYSLGEGESKTVHDITVAPNGQAFYRSTGENSGLPGVWLPFVFINPSYQDLTDSDWKNLINTNKNLYGVISLRKHITGWIVKIDALWDDAKRPEDLYCDVMKFIDKTNITYHKDPIVQNIFKIAKRCLLMEYMKTSYSLGGDIWNEELKNKISKIWPVFLAEIKPIKLEKEPMAVMHHPKEINQWLILRRANIASSIFQSELTQAKSVNQHNDIKNDRQDECRLI